MDEIKCRPKLLSEQRYKVPFPDTLSKTGEIPSNGTNQMGARKDSTAMVCVRPFYRIVPF